MITSDIALWKASVFYVLNFSIDALAAIMTIAPSVKIISSSIMEFVNVKLDGL